MATTISIGLQKGGVGKTSTALALSSCLGSLGKKVLLVDLDSQANSTEGSGVSPEASIYNCFEETKTTKEVIVNTSLYDLLPADERLAILEKMDEDQMIKNEIKPTLLKSVLSKIQKGYDYIIIDTPPGLGNLLQFALVASDYCLIPCEPRPFALNRLDSFYETVRASNSRLKVLGLLLVKYNERTVLNKQIRLAIETKARLMKTKVFDTYIRDGVAVPESQIMQIPLIEYAPKSKPCLDYIEVTKEILERLGDK